MISTKPQKFSYCDQLELNDNKQIKNKSLAYDINTEAAKAMRYRRPSTNSYSKYYSMSIMHHAQMKMTWQETLSSKSN